VSDSVATQFYAAHSGQQGQCCKTQEREPEALLRSLLQSLGRKGEAIHHALFVPPDSKYSDPTKKASPVDQVDLRWQSTLRGKWEALIESSNPSHSQACLLIPPWLPCFVSLPHLHLWGTGPAPTLFPPAPCICVCGTQN